MKHYKVLDLLADKVIDKQWTLDNAQAYYNCACYDYNAKLKECYRVKCACYDYNVKIKECDRVKKEEERDKELTRLLKIKELRAEIFLLDDSLKNSIEKEEASKAYFSLLYDDK